MRFVVDLYRYLIIIFLGVLVAAAAYGLAQLVSAETSISAWMVGYVAAIFGVAILIIAALGIIATMISVHDRHAEIVDELRMLREHITGSSSE